MRFIVIAAVVVGVTVGQSPPGTNALHHYDDACPFVNGSFVSIEDEVAWKVIDLIMTPNTRVEGPNQQAVFQLQPLFAALNQSTNCLVCYSYAFEPITTVSRLLCNDSTDAYAALHEQEARTMQVFMTKIELPSGHSKDYGCNIGLFQHVVMNSTATSTLQCWLRPLVTAGIQLPPTFTEETAN